ncbi:hypothetical protein Dsin_008585 [Dipteronia sinensis]|uniref:Zinc knuckle CX2CX4HX4C domain-containing protein n=1 Tax=Dipteronia sinensis TaxID=43782 RepID=A0AAE0ECM8_9ROSI|nr:hypothetical protein Dsin_008579 [Dipteronia sinensis]KAK3221560.1 hypothetical protein Dsin_008585 [Dipteronia sinensis]
MIGEVCDFDASTTSDGIGRFLRVRVKVRVDKPLRRSLRVDVLGNGIITTMPLHYERLLDYYFKCGCLGQIMDGCLMVNTHNNISLDETRKLGVWLQAVSPPKQSSMGNGRFRNKNLNKSKNFGGSRTETGTIGRFDDNWRRKTFVMVHESDGRNKKESEQSKGTESQTTVPDGPGCTIGSSLNILVVGGSGTEESQLEGKRTKEAKCNIHDATLVYSDERKPRDEEFVAETHKVGRAMETNAEEQTYEEVGTGKCLDTVMDTIGTLMDTEMQPSLASVSGSNGLATKVEEVSTTANEEVFSVISDGQSLLAC